MKAPTLIKQPDDAVRSASPTHSHDIEGDFTELNSAVDDVEEVLQRLMDLMSHYKKRISVLDADKPENAMIPMSQAEIKIMQVMYKLRLQVDVLYSKNTLSNKTEGLVKAGMP